MAQWVEAIVEADLQSRGRAVFRHEGRQIALFAIDGAVFACNNRCPHEGYPLSEGSLDEGCVLTCNWHNWKFDLSSGDNVYQGERLRVYPVEIRDGTVWVDITDPPFEARRDALLDSLIQAALDNDYERVARELARLDRMGVDPHDPIRAVLAWGAPRMEYGWTHAFAGLADWLAIAEEHDDAETRLVCRLEGLGHIADDVLREPEHPFPTGSEPYDEDRFVAAVEVQDEALAIRLVRGGLEAGLGFAGLERGLTRSALAHYNAFGHSLIYVPKAGALIERLGPEVAEPLLLSLVRHHIYARREDLIPEFRRYGGCLERWNTSGDGEPLEPHTLRGLGINRALERVCDASAVMAPEEIHAALLGTSALNLLAFDASHEHRAHVQVSDNIGWLDYTHPITFASALRIQCRKFPELWAPGLLQLACFSGRAAGFAKDTPALDDWRVTNPEQFFTDTLDALVHHDMDEYIVSVHYVKTVLAAREEWRSKPAAPIADALVAAANRVANARVRLKQPRRVAYQAAKFVELDG